ncbi:LPS export ABC transporter permease LptG [Porticoccaceae bacterium LTM1]|nr:LPS export ABC transporter permease LptG [Porticoccaceae bacterium LTM1]
MKRLSDHVASSVLTSIIGVLLILVGVDILSALYNEADELGERYSFMNALFYVAMTIPSRIYEFIPYSSLVGCLVGLGSLAGNSELVVMRAAGVSLLRIVWFVMKPVLVIIVFGIGLAEYLVPHSEQSANTYKALRQGSGQVRSSDSDLWVKEGNEYIHINAVAPGNALYGVARYRFDDDRQLQEASFSERVTFKNSYWEEENVSITRFAEEHSSTEVDSELVRRWDTELSPNVLRLSSLPIQSLSIGGLHEYANYLQQQGQDAAPYWLGFWSKSLQPISVLSLVLVAISFIFGPLRQVTMGFRIFTGVILGLAFNISQEMLGPSSLVYGFSPVIAVLIPVSICALIGLLLLRRAA